MAKNRLIISVLATILSILSCSFPGEPTADPLVEQATDLAATLASVVDATATAANFTPPPTIAPTQVTEVPRVFQLVYTDQGNVWIAEGENPPAQLTFGGGVERILLSPDGTRLIFTRRNSPDERLELRMFRLESGEDVPVLSADEVANLHPLPEGVVRFEIGMMAFQPFTHSLFFNTTMIFDGPGINRTDDIFRLDVDGGDVAEFLPPGEGGDFQFSPDGSHLIVIRPETIDLIDSDGGNRISDIISYDPVTTYSEFRYYAQPVWAPDSSTFGVAIPSAEPLGEDVYGTVWTVAADGGPAQNHGRIDGDFYFTQVFSAPSLSPNLDQVAFTRESGEGRALYLAQLDGNNQIFVESDVITWENWSPDGGHFAFTRTQPTEVVIAKADGGIRVELLAIDLRWISAEKFAFTWGVPGDWALRTGDLDGIIHTLANPTSDFVDYDFLRE
jgi:dipeptidyl aminopeptidase/acylaminoacyl peptidase